MLGKLSYFVGASFILAASASAQTIAPLTIKSVKANGTGCNVSDVGFDIAVISGDEQAVTVFFNDFIAESVYGDWQKGGLQRKTCNVSMDIQVPSGYQYANTKVDLLGYYSLSQPGDTITQSSRYWFQGNLSTNFLNYSTTIMKNYDGNCWKWEGRSWVYTTCSGEFTAQDNFNVATYVWSPCGGKRNLNIAMSSTANSTQAGGQAALYVDLLEASIDTQYSWDPRKNSYWYSVFKTRYCQP